MRLLRPVDSTILFFQENLVVVMILEYTRIECDPFAYNSNGLIRPLSRTHKSRLRKISIERLVVWGQ